MQKRPWEQNATNTNANKLQDDENAINTDLNEPWEETCLSMGTGSAFKRRDVVQTFLEGAAQISILLHSTLLYSTLLYSTLLYSTALYCVILDSITVYFTSLAYSSTVLFSFSLLPLLYCSTLLFASIPLLVHSSTALF